MPLKKFLSFLFFIFLMGSPLFGQQEEESPEFAQGGRTRSPKLELGLGFFAFNYNDYRGADHRSSLFWPIPYVIYRGKYVGLENSTVRGYLYDQGSFRVGMSLMASLRVSTRYNSIRAGMPSLDPVFEIGPSAMYDFWSDPTKHHFLTLGVPVRAAFASNLFYAHNKGFFSVPYIAYTALPQPATLNSFVQLSAGAMFATQKYHDYYYSVGPNYVRNDRPYYRAVGGYSGAHTMLYLSKDWNCVFGFFFLRYDWLQGATFMKSPLIQRKDYFTFGGGLIWYFYQSDEREERNRLDG